MYKTLQYFYCTMQYSAKCSLAITYIKALLKMMTERTNLHVVCPSVTLVDHDHIG